MQDSSYILSQIREFAVSLGFLEVGYASIFPLKEDADRFVKSMESGYFADLNYLKRNIEKRENPQLLVEGAKSVLVFLAPYGKQLAEPDDEYINISISSKSHINNLSDCNIDSGELVVKHKVAQYALGDDYHIVIKSKLNMVLERMKKLDSNINGRVFVDTAPVLERAWAVQAGLGFIGKNNFFISREHGIRNFIGVVISNFEIKDSGCFDKQGIIQKSVGLQKKYCGSCTKCLDACPTGALCAPYSLDARKCVSYLTIENKDATPENNMEMAMQRGRWIFGCDACMNACPWNSRNKPGWPEFGQQSDPLPYTHLRRR